MTQTAPSRGHLVSFEPQRAFVASFSKLYYVIQYLIKDIYKAIQH